MGKMPKGWKSVPLGSILSQEQIEYTLHILQRPVSDTEKTNMLKQYYRQFAKELQAKGFEPDFLAYAIPYWIGQTAEDEAARQREEDERFARDFTKDRLN